VIFSLIGSVLSSFLRCFDAVVWVTGWASGL